MRIGVNALYLLPGQVGGTEVYLRSILPAIIRAAPSDEFFIFVNRETESLLSLDLDRATHVRCRVAATSRPARILYEQLILPLLIRQHRLDLLWNPGFTAPVLSPAPMVTSIHDLQFKVHPQFFRRVDLLFWKLLVWAAVKRSRILVTFCSETSIGLQQVYGVSSKKVFIAPHGVDPAMFHLPPQKRGRPVRMTLAVSTLHPHKNLDRLLEAFALFRLKRPSNELVIAGLHGFAAEKLDVLRTRLRLNDCVTFTGWIPREQLYDLFARADAFIYPSLFEGFGMPVVEALAAGIPTACSAIEPLVSISNKAALTFNPEKVSEIAEVMEKLIEFDGSAGPVQAMRYRWEYAAQVTLDAMHAAST